MQTQTLITAATSGIGAGIARRILTLSSESDHVFVNYGHRTEQAEAFRDSIEPLLQSRLSLIQADLSSYEGMMRLVDVVKKQSSQETFLDELILCAGISLKKAFSDYTFEEFNHVLEVNLSLPAFLVKELLPYMKEGGSILFIGSYAGKQAYSSSLVYGVSKSAVHFLTRSLVKETEPKQIRVNAIAPGFIQTPWHQGRSQESFERINRKIALHRFGQAEEIAEMAVSILRNGYMNGSVVDIHGGYDYF
ncbi:MAG: SDR family oxidoreductase [Blautia sp.]|nr:SDR family oxidoreductase [Blautia sp.]